MSNISYFAIKTISFQKIKEFFSEFQYTIISPLVSTIIFVVILSAISNYYSLDAKGNYLNFVVPGIIIMTVMQVSYQNISESLIFMKQIGSFNVYLMSPISRTEILFSMLTASIFIGIFTLNYQLLFSGINQFGSGLVFLGAVVLCVLMYGLTLV